MNLATNIPRNVDFTSRRLLGAFVLTFAASTPLFFLLILIHEGGHGLLLVPAMILGAPPFTNSLLILLILSIPLGNAAVAVVSWLAYKSANRCKNPGSSNATTCFTLLFSLFLMTFNFFWIDLITGEDFALNFWEPLGIPLYANWPLQLIISLFSHVAFPAYLIMEKSFGPELVIGISAGTGAGILMCLNHVVPPIAPILRENFFLLVTIGFPVFPLSVWVLHRLSRAREAKDVFTVFENVTAPFWFRRKRNLHTLFLCTTSSHVALLLSQTLGIACLNPY